MLDVKIRDTSYLRPVIGTPRRRSNYLFACPFPDSPFSVDCPAREMSPQAEIEPAKVMQEALTAVMWTGVGFQLLFPRIPISRKTQSFTNLFLDDALIVSAWLIFLANVILYRVILPTV